MMNYKSKQTSYDLAHEIAQKAKKILGLSQYDVETLISWKKTSEFRQK